jgi:hypothetical protein
MTNAAITFLLASLSQQFSYGYSELSQIHPSAPGKASMAALHRLAARTCCLRRGALPERFSGTLPAKIFTQNLQAHPAFLHSFYTPVVKL